MQLLNCYSAARFYKYVLSFNISATILVKEQGTSHVCLNVNLQNDSSPPIW